MLRTEILCTGPAICPNANAVRCHQCGDTNTVADTNIVECPSCKSPGTVVQRCKECPMSALAKAQNESEAGKQLEVALEIDHAITNYKVPWDEVTSDQDLLLRILKEERNRCQAENMERDRQR